MSVAAHVKSRSTMPGETYARRRHVRELDNLIPGDVFPQHVLGVERTLARNEGLGRRVLRDASVEAEGAIRGSCRCAAEE